MPDLVAHFAEQLSAGAGVREAGALTGTPLTAGDLRRQMGVSGAAITYLVERMVETGHLRREIVNRLHEVHSATR